MRNKVVLDDSTEEFANGVNALIEKINEEMYEEGLILTDLIR
jgi:hypothetical protein